MNSSRATESIKLWHTVTLRLASNTCTQGPLRTTVGHRPTPTHAQTETTCLSFRHKGRQRTQARASSHRRVLRDNFDCRVHFRSGRTPDQQWNLHAGPPYGLGIRTGSEIHQRTTGTHIEASLVHLAGNVHHLVQGRGNKTTQAKNICFLLSNDLQNLSCVYICHHQRSTRFPPKPMGSQTQKSTGIWRPSTHM